MGIAAGNQHGREGRGEKKIVELDGANQAFGHFVRHAEKAFGRLVLHDYAMLGVREDDRIGHALHHGAHLRDGDLHIAHAVVIMLNLE